MRTAKELSELFGALDPNEIVWCTFITKDHVKDSFSECEYTEENDELIETENLVTDEAIKRVFDSVDDDDWLWERFNENYNDTCRSVLSDLIDERNQAKEDTDLWDKEQASVTSKDD